jgi:hypothetical protein
MSPHNPLIALTLDKNPDFLIGNVARCPSLKNNLWMGTNWKPFQNCESGSGSRRVIEFNRLNTLNISRIKLNGPTPELGHGRNFETASKNIRR